MPVFIPYYRDQIGLTFNDFLIGEAVFAGVVVALEVPTGWLSDVWKRKYVLACAAVFWIASFALLLFARTFIEMIVAQCIVGIAVSLFSGTMSAMLYDSLIVLNRESEYSRLEGKRQGLGFYSIALAGIVGGFLYDLGPQVPMAATAFVAVPALICTLLMTEPPRHKSAVQRHPLADMFLTVKYALHGHAEVGFIIIFAAALFCGTKLMMWSQQPYYMALNLPENIYGILMAAGFTLAGTSSHISHRFDGHVSNLGFLSVALAFTLLVSILASIGPGLHGVALLMIGGSCIFGLASPRVNDAINKRVESDRRATILSTCSLLRELFFIPVSLLVGALTDRGGITFGLHGVTGWLVIAAIFVGLWAYTKKA